MAILRRSTVILAKMPLVLRSHPNVFDSHSFVHKMCVRFYSQLQMSKDKEEVPFYLKYLPKFIIRKREFATRSYDEPDVTDYHEKSDLDFYVPLKDYNKIFERAIKAETTLKYERAENLKLMKYERAEYLKLIIMPLLRTEFEEFEQLYLPAIQLSKQDMIQNLKESYASFSIPSSIAEVEELSFHYVSMMYILKNSTDTHVLTFKNYLNKKGIDDDIIARVSVILYKKSSAVTHNILADISIKDVELGLRKNGINDDVQLSVVKALFAIQRDKINELN